MATQWTEQQLSAMEPSDRLTVLSAAAGSGKTTVLVARAISLLLDEEKPVPADRMLIVTFSNASAAEFRKRIEKGINEKIRENPRNNYIRMQKIALQKADISTIHSFCIKLVRENFQSLDISPDFTICDEAQADSLHRQAIDLAMAYGYGLEDFKQLVSFYGKSSNDGKIKEFLRQMNYFFSALPHPETSAAKMAEEYRATDMKATAAYSQLKNSLAQQADYLVYLAQRMDSLYQNADFEGYENGINLVKNQSAQIAAAVAADDSDILHALLAAKAVSLGRAKPAGRESKAINELVYKEYKKTAENMLKTLEYMDGETYAQHIMATDRYVQVLFNVYLKYQQLLMEIKKERKTFEFSDFEHFALKLLQNEDGSATPMATALQDKYEYIMEDEFQDTSYVQDAIFTMIARPGQENLYVVGDVKQSIYGFRKASPRIFLNKRQIGIDDSEKGRTIYLPHNFRSSYSVIEGVNYIFRRLMSKACGGVDYDEHEALMTLKQPDGQPGVKLNIYTENEAANTAAAISRMIKDGYIIKDGDSMRPVKSGDFCILMRNTKHFREYKKELEKLGYEAFVRDDELILQKPEIQSILTLMRVLANPLQEVYLTAAMFGDLFGFSLDEILKIRTLDSRQNLYKALAVSDSPKAADMLALLKELGYMAGIYSADKLIDSICKKTGYYSRLAFTEDGTAKRENIRWFMDFARNWAKSHPSNLASFLRWTDMYLENGKAIAAEGQKSDDAIAIMTMHTSKGLEFPVVFVTGLATKFNTQDTSRRLLLDTELGIGMYANTRFGYNNSTMNIHAIRSRISRSMADEEMRLLYVAFTRSKNLLVLSAAYNNIFTPNSTAKIAACTGDRPHPVQLQNMSTPVHWVLAALAGHPAVADEFSYGREDKNIPQCINVAFDADNTETAGETVEDTAAEITADLGKIAANFDYSYPHSARTKLPIKMSVSEIAKSSPLILAKPDFINGDKATAAEKGTAMHAFAQHADILLARTDLENTLANMERDGLIDRKLLNIPAIEKFLFSDVADMILNSKKVYTEKDFLVPFSASEILGDEVYSQDEILVQGVMDCVLENDGEITVIDYKTDYVHSMDTLFARYKKQLEMYRHGAKQLFNTEKVKCVLYSFHLNEYIVF